jgi:hypothetical protein
VSETRELIYVPCDCHTTEHFLRISEDWCNPELVDVEFLSTRNCSFWHRVKWALKHVFGGEDLIFADVIVNREKLLAALVPAQPVEEK